MTPNNFNLDNAVWAIVSASSEPQPDGSYLLDADVRWKSKYAHAPAWRLSRVTLPSASEEEATSHAVAATIKDIISNSKVRSEDLGIFIFTDCRAYVRDVGVEHSLSLAGIKPQSIGRLSAVDYKYRKIIGWILEDTELDEEFSRLMCAATAKAGISEDEMVEYAIKTIENRNYGLN